MDRRGQRPPRSARPPSVQLPSPADYEPPNVPYGQHYGNRPPMPPIDSYTNVSFQGKETGDRHDPIDQSRARTYNAYNNHQLQLPESAGDAALAEGGASGVGRKKSLVRPDREKIEPGHRLWHYRNHAQQMEYEGGGNAIPSSTYCTPV